MILDKKIESRERYMKLLPRLCKKVQKMSVELERDYEHLTRAGQRDASKAEKVSRKPSPSCRAFIRSSTSNSR